MSLIQYQGWPILDALRRDLEDNFSVGSGAGSAVGTWSPRVDVYEFKDRYELHADLPGVKPDNVDLSLEDGVLTLSGQREEIIHGEEGAERTRREVLVGRFERRFHLPRTIDSTGVSARSSDGVLQIVIPKHEQAQPMKIKVAA